MTDGVVLPDQRILETWEGGDPAGAPVILQHGTPSGRLQAALADAAAQRQGVRLLSFSRPGYGRSTDSPPSLASVGRDTLRVADAFGVDGFAVLGTSGGGPYAIATGIADPERVRAVGLIGGVGPWRLIGPSDPLDPDLPLLALVDAGDIAGALEGFRRQAAQEFDDLLALDDEAMVDGFFRGVPADDVGWLGAEARVLWAMDARDALSSYDGYARDNVAWGGGWDIDPTDLTVPTWLWYGGGDLVVPVAHGRWLAGRIPRSALVVRSGEGHGSTVFGHWDEAFAALVRHLSDE